jgi:DNA-binding transcriptional LysR family regulator
MAVLPDYLAKYNPNLVSILEDVDMPVFDTYFVYPSDLKDTKRVNVFLDFLVAKAREWSF